MSATTANELAAFLERAHHGCSDECPGIRAADMLRSQAARIGTLTALLRRCVEDPETGGLYQLGLDAAYAATGDDREKEQAAIEAAGAVMQAATVALKETT